MKTKSIEQYRADYKDLQDAAGRFGVEPQDFNARVRSLLGRGNPTPPRLDPQRPPGGRLDLRWPVLPEGRGRPLCL